MKLKSAQFVGFFPKKTAVRPDGFNNPVIEEICSVSECISEGPVGWVKKWKHNELGFFNSEKIAREIIGQNPEVFDLYAYKMFPLEFNHGNVSAYSISVQLSWEFPDYEFLGYDCISRSTGSSFFECSALSCNAGYEEFPVNRYCLLDDFDAAYQAAAEFSKDKYEPGPYYLFEVYRKKAKVSST